MDIVDRDRAKYGISGDKAEAFLTEVIRKFPFPEFEGENFLSEGVVWAKLSNAGYLLRYFNDIIYVCDYLPDGLTASGISIFKNNPKGWGLLISQDAEYHYIGYVEKWKRFFHYYSTLKSEFSFHQIAKNINMDCLVLKIGLTAATVLHFYRDQLKKLRIFLKNEN